MQNLKIRPLLFRSERSIFNMLFKRLAEESFEDLRVVIENFESLLLCSIKWRSFKGFAKLHESPLLTPNIVNSTISGLRQYFATESSWKMMKNDFYFIPTRIRVGFLGVCFGVGERVKLPLCLKLVRIMLETWNLVRK